MAAKETFIYLYFQNWGNKILPATGNMITIFDAIYEVMSRMWGVCRENWTYENITCEDVFIVCCKDLQRLNI